MEGLLKAIDAKVDALKQDLFDEFQEYLGSVLLEISQKHNLNLDELQGEYLSCSDGSGSDGGSEVKAKRAPAKRKAAKVSGDDKAKCTATTAKGAPCKNLALTGGTLCACHSKSKAPKNSRVDKIRRDVNKGRVKPVSLPSSDSESEDEAPKVKGKEIPPRRPFVKRAVVEVAEMKKVAAEIDALFESGGESDVESVGENKEDVVSQEVAAEIDALFESGEDEESDEESDVDDE
jgi:hypothetical protein